MATLTKEIAYAPDAFRMLKGCFSLYKPGKKGFNKTTAFMKQKISDELNSMECRPPRERIEITGDLTDVSCEDNELNVEIKTNYADHPLVSGPRYSPDYISLSLTNYPGWYSSGLAVGFIGQDAHKSHHFRRLKLPKLYEISGQFGLASINFRNDGKVVAKSTFKHVKKEHFYRILSKIEAAQRSMMFKVAGVDIRSEDAYRMAADGFVPAATNKTAPIVYAIQAQTFNPPDFTIKIQCINEHEQFLAELVNEIGLALRTTAFCTGIRLTNYGPFSVENALLQKHWTLDNIIENIYYCNQILQKYEQEKQITIGNNRHFHSSSQVGL